MVNFRLDQHMTPEIFRTPLHEIGLSIKLLRLGPIGLFLAKAIEPPPIDAVIEAEALLKGMTCLWVWHHMNTGVGIGFYVKLFIAESGDRSVSCAIGLSAAVLLWMLRIRCNVSFVEVSSNQSLVDKSIHYICTMPIIGTWIFYYK